MTDAALRRLNRAEYDQAWDRVEASLGFRPSLTDFPGVREPAPSVTWSLRELREDDPRGHRRDRLIDTVQDALTACTPPGARLLLLNWQHTCWTLRPDLPSTDDVFLPRVLDGRARPGWPLSPYPDHDYYFFLAEDLGHGTFGHPWEPSLCLFGAPLLQRAADALHRLLPTVLRRDGRPVRPREQARPAQEERAVRHVRVTWTHDFADEPVEILSELDEEDREGRKVEVFHGGRLARADASHETAATGLGEVPFPPLETIDALEDFTARPMTAAAFEQAWTAARRTGRTPPSSP
ncbi:DUF2716 domain-containing protein [Streptomyces sp. NPDC001380]|uniref:DUF2716 domain-containing protein n=1 Tax=Streptomyces sp. NPDC001380 TaxID=3364566 RepID=UPI0036AE2E47